MFLLLVMLLLKSALRTERQWNDLETHGQFPTTVFTSHQVLRLRLSAEITRLRSRRCGRSRVFCVRCCCCKLRQLRELEVQEQRLVYAAVRARFLVPPAPKREATGARDRRGSLAALMNAHGQRNAYVCLKPDQDSLYREKGTATRFTRRAEPRPSLLTDVAASRSHCHRGEASCSVHRGWQLRPGRKSG